MKTEGRQKPILFFDGICNLCNQTVDSLLKWDRSGRILFASLQGTTASQKLPLSLTTQVDSVILLSRGKTFVKSEAILEVFVSLGWPYKIFTALRIIPLPIRDRAYDFVAKNRIRWFGKRETCRIPTPVEKVRFLP